MNTRRSAKTTTKQRNQDSTIPDGLQHFDLLPDGALVRLPVVLGLFGCSPATVWRMVRAGTIPAPVKMTARIAGWRVGDLRSTLNGIAGNKLDKP